MRQCQKCGNMILDGQVACAKCGTPVQPAQPQSATQTLSGSAMPVMGRPVQPLAAAPAAATSSAATDPAMANSVTAPAAPANTQPLPPVQPVDLSSQPLGAETLAQPATQPAPQSAVNPSPVQPSAQPNPFNRSALPPVQPMQPAAESQSDKLESSIDQIAAEQQPLTAVEPLKGSKKGFDFSVGGKISKKTWIIIGVCAAILLVVIVVIVVMMSSGSKSNSSNSTPNTTIVSETKLDIGDYTITVPEGYSYEIEADGSVDLTDDPENWIANINYIDNVSYTALANDFSTVAASYQQLMGVSKVQDAGTATIGGRDYLYVDVIGTEEGVTGTYAYTNIGDNVLEMIIETADKEFNHDLLENLTPIADGAEKNVGIEDSFLGDNRMIIRLNLSELIKALPASDTTSETVEDVEEIEF